MVYFVGRLIGWPMVQPPKKTSPLWSHWFIYIIIELEKALRSCSEFLPRRSTRQQRPIATIWLTIWQFFVSPPFGQRKNEFSAPTLHGQKPGSRWEKNSRSAHAPSDMHPPLPGSDTDVDAPPGFGSREGRGELPKGENSYEAVMKTLLPWEPKTFNFRVITFIFHGFGVQGYFLLNPALFNSRILISFFSEIIPIYKPG